MRVTVLAAIAAAALLSTISTGPAQATVDEVTKKGKTADRASTATSCQEVSSFGRIDICLSQTADHRGRRLVQKSARHYVPSGECDKFEKPQAYVYWYSVSGIRANGTTVLGSRYIKQNFWLDGCSNT